MDSNMILQLLLITCLVNVISCVYEEPQYKQQYYKEPLYKHPPPRILSHHQAQSHDGGFKFAFTAENGLQQTEHTAPDGTRNGGYTYIDPNGKTISVKYTAGKDGFRILEGDHIPKEVHASHAENQGGKNEHDDGSYNAEKYEKPEEQLQQHRPQPVYIQQYAPQKQFVQPQKQYVQPLYAPPQKPYYAPDKSQYRMVYLTPQPKQYSQYATQDTSASNSLENTKNYNEEPGKAYSFGGGYAFQFTN